MDADVGAGGGIGDQLDLGALGVAAQAALDDRGAGAVAGDARGLQVAAQGAGGEPAQVAEPAAVTEKVGPQPLGQLQHHLAVRHAQQQAFAQPQAPLGEAVSVKSFMTSVESR